MPTHAERRVLRHSPEQLFNLVADIERYPEFLPWCKACRIRQREASDEAAPDVLVADMAIGFKVFRETFTSRVATTPFDRIDVTYADGPFKYLNNHWKFLDHPDGCEIDFFVDFEFRSRVLQVAIGAVFNEAVRRMIAAFETRADALYGRN